MEATEVTRVFELYMRGRHYNQRLYPSQYDLVETNTEFFFGNQWRNLPDTPEINRLPHPTFNIIKRIVTLFIANLTSSKVTIRVEPLAASALPAALQENEDDPVKYANALLDNLMEKLKMEFRFRQALCAGAITGDFAAHFWFDPDARPFFPDPAPAASGTQYEGEIRMELVPGINVMFGNPNNRNVEDQPYILLVGRAMTRELREEARRNRRYGGDPNSIEPDSETQDMSGDGKIELEADAEDGKTLYIIMYEKKSGKDGKTTIFATKATKTGIVYRDVNTRLSFYPLAWGNWERYEQRYHGRALVTGVIDNQISINLLAASMVRHLQQTAFPKIVYNRALLSSWSNRIGESIGVNKVPPGMRLSEIVQAIPVPEMSAQIHQTLNEIVSLTKECLGATDSLTGDVNPTNTSATMIVMTNSEVPLENIRAEMYEWAEDIGRILLDMAGTYYGKRYVEVLREVVDLIPGPDGLAQIDPVTHTFRTMRRKVRLAEMFDFSRLKDMSFSLRINAGGTTYFNEIARTQTLDNLYQRNIITREQYLKRLPDNLILDKEELLEEILTSLLPDASMGGAVGGRPAQGGPLEEAAAIHGLPGNLAAQYKNMNGVAQRTAREMGARSLR